MIQKNNFGYFQSKCYTIAFLVFNFIPLRLHQKVKRLMSYFNNTVLDGDLKDLKMFASSVNNRIIEYFLTETVLLIKCRNNNGEK